MSIYTYTHSILASSDWETSEKLLILVHSGPGLSLGIFSRSLLMDEGLSKHTVLPYISRAKEMGYGIMILRPNVNTIEVSEENGISKKIPIVGSETPDIHVLGVWDTLVTAHPNIKHVALIGFGSGASLCKDLYVRQMVRSKEDKSEINNIKAIVTVEASQIIDIDDGNDIKSIFKDFVINMESNAASKGCLLEYLKSKFHVPTVSLGGVKPGKDKNVNASYSIAIDPIFTYLKIAEDFHLTPTAGTSAVVGNTINKRFINAMFEMNGLNESTGVISVNSDYMPSPIDDAHKKTTNVRSSPPAPLLETAAVGSSPSTKSFFNYVSSSFRQRPKTLEAPESMSVSDFELLRVVGKGAFGKVMQVRKISNNQIYAMKILKKQYIIEKGQVAHTIAEQQILCSIHHPYIVSLKYSFQTREKLYIITDYYNGGSLFFHLRNSKCFTVDRAKFYAAELLLSLSHLHSHQIIYRDLKLENVLMDHLGHIALTDFGLSKQDIDKSGGATTFCGTAEYMAPELLKGQKYGHAVDWWSFGILLFEMINGRTPFYDKNRKLMFFRITSTEPVFPPLFQPDAVDVIKKLLKIDISDRLGTNSADEIKATAFFSTINFDKLYNKEIVPPFRPDVSGQTDTKYVASSLLQADVKDSIAEAPKKGDSSNFGDFNYTPDDM